MSCFPNGKTGLPLGLHDEIIALRKEGKVTKVTDNLQGAFLSEERKQRFSTYQGCGIPSSELVSLWPVL